MLRVSIIIFSATFVMFAAAAHVEAQSPSCAPRGVAIEQLESRYGETRRSVGLASSNQVIEVFASEETGSWTIIATTADGLTCLVAVGRAFESVNEALPGKGDKL